MQSKAICRLMLPSIFVLFYSQSAISGQPVKQEPYQFDFLNAPVASCEPWGYDFLILADGSIRFEETWFFDNDGNLERKHILFRVSGDSVYKNSVDPSKKLDLSPGWGASRWVDWTTGDMVQAGAYTKVTVPGYGAVALGVGRLAINSSGIITFQAGKANFVYGDLEMLCSVLA